MWRFYIFIVLSQFIVILLYNVSLHYIKKQRIKGNPKFVDDYHYNKISNILYSVCFSFIIISVLIFFTVYYRSNKSFYFVIAAAALLGICAMIIKKLRIPYIEGEYKKGNPKYSDENRIQNMIKRLNYISIVLASIAVILLLFSRFSYRLLK